MRILMLSPTLGDAFGQERVMRDSSDLLRKAGHEVFFLAESLQGNVPDSDGIQLVKGLQIHALSSPTLVKTVKRQVLAYCQNVRPDIIHLIDQFDPRILNILSKNFPTMMTSHTVATSCPASTRLIHGGGVCLEKSGWKCLFYNKNYGCLSSFKNDLHRINAIFNYRRKIRALQTVRRMGAISRYVQRTLVHDGWDPERVTLLYNPVEIPKNIVPLRDTPENLIVCAARLVEHKGIGHLLRALKKIENGSWNLWICGDGPLLESLRALGDELSLSDRVRFLGRTPYLLTRQIIAASRIVIAPNIGPEPFGLSPAEASAMAKPVVAFDVPAINEIIEHGRTGLLAKPFETQSLSGCISQLLEDRQLSEQLGGRGPELIASRFSPNTHLEATLAAYRRCLSESSTSMEAA